MPADQLPPDDVTGGESWLIPRPAVVLLDLPVAFRWEVTRRHPYYLRFWHLAREHRQHANSDPDQRRLGEAAVLVLHALGVSGDPPPPGASAARLGASSLGPAWEGGAIAPLTCRGLVGLLLASLPADARAQVGQFLLASAGPAADASQPTYEALLELHRLAHPALDTSPGRPVVGLNLNAPQRAVTQAVEELVRQLKREQGLGERRRRDDKLDGYLSAWDLREGWAGDHYDGSREQTLREIARQQRLPLSTVAHHYRTAFRLIVGREYTPERWARVMGAGKLYAWLDPHEVPRRTLRRPWRNRQPRPVPEAALAPPAAEGPSHFLDTAGISADELAYVDLVLDLQELVARGWSDAAILAELELTTPAAAEILTYLRQRHHDAL